MTYLEWFPEEVLSGLNDGFGIFSCDNLSLVGVNEVRGENDGYADIYSNYVIALKGLTPAEAEELLKQTARKVPGVFTNGDPSSCWGSGIVDAYNAWSSAFTSNTIPNPPNFPIICGIPCYVAGPLFCPWCWECKDPPTTNDPCDLCEVDINSENYDTENCHSCVDKMLNIPEYRNRLEENEDCGICVDNYMENGWEEAMHSEECQACITTMKQQYYNSTVTGG